MNTTTNTHFWMAVAEALLAALVFLSVLPVVERLRSKSLTWNN